MTGSSGPEEPASPEPEEQSSPEPDDQASAEPDEQVSVEPLERAATWAGPAPATAEDVPARRGLLLLSLVFLSAVVVVELVAGAALRPVRSAHPVADVLALPGVPALVHDAQADPGEMAQVAARQPRQGPLAVPSQALLDGLLLVAAVAVAAPRLVRGPALARAAPLTSFLLSLAILLGGIVVVVKDIARLRALLALYLSPPFGTLSYLLLYGSSPRRGALAVLAGLMILKLAAAASFFLAFPRASSDRGVVALALTSVAATAAAALAYATSSSARAPISDALAAAVIALVAIVWAGMILSGTVRRLT